MDSDGFAALVRRGRIASEFRRSARLVFTLRWVDCYRRLRIGRRMQRISKHNKDMQSTFNALAVYIYLPRST